jgi:hypothetical protein
MNVPNQNPTIKNSYRVNFAQPYCMTWFFREKKKKKKKKKEIFLFSFVNPIMKNLSSELIELIGSYCSEAKDRASLCQVSQSCYAATIHLLYRHIMITGPRHYLAFKHTVLEQHHALADYVQRLDFSSYTTRGSRWTEEKAKSVMVPDQLASLIMGCQQLQALLVGEEMIHVFASPLVIRSIFNRDNRLQTVDFTGFCDRTFTSAMTDFFTHQHKKGMIKAAPAVKIEEDWSIPQRLNNISFYMCMALSQEHFFIPFFDKLTQYGNQLTRLDLAHTQITSQLFLHLPNVRTLTHLNLQGCHSLTCCSPLIPFLTQQSQLHELNLNMDFNGIGGSRFCHDCIFQVLRQPMPHLQSLDMGGHTNLDDIILSQMVMPKLKYLSLAYCRFVSLEALIQFLSTATTVVYLNLARTPFSMEMTCLPQVLQQIAQKTNVKVIEISPFAPKKYPLQVQQWNLQSYGRRTYYSRRDVDPRYMYSKKLILLDGQKLSPMNNYWCYSY